jgi:hypothetical protein
MAGLPDAPVKSPSPVRVASCAETDPGHQFVNERRGIHLCCVGRHHVLQDLLDDGALCQEDEAHITVGTRLFEQAKFLCG